MSSIGSNHFNTAAQRSATDTANESNENQTEALKKKNEAKEKEPDPEDPPKVDIDFDGSVFITIDKVKKIIQPAPLDTQITF
ncbi:hypothetical protein [Pseudomonas poae]|uniref:Uncharacterized protein n=1 Tax=Pseudomonas poae TaxID=200451 RepID=A0A2S9EW47_9PSED|nr:hypothetical protein [Pseudomonas poae]PRA28911.1 hypothetical protein CQZ97_14885 [Pseudomonas poae]PRC20608.1 hypothetical protein CQZ99_08130 [Pseudomonas poae]